MNNCPRITVVTPSYNQGRFLGNTIRSVIEQEYPDLEFFVVDGGSTDHSAEIIRRYADRISWRVSERDRGQSDAINKGFRRATGDILGWINSDDEYCPGAFDRVAAFFREHPECDAVVGDLIVIDGEGRPLDLKKAVQVRKWYNLYSGCAVAQPATFFTRRAYEIAGDVDETLHYQMDYEYFLRMQMRGVRFGLLKTPLARFRVHADSKTVSEYQRKFWQDFAAIQDRFLRGSLQGRSRAGYRQGMKWLARAAMYAERSLTRGPRMPFASTRARNRGAA